MASLVPLRLVVVGPCDGVHDLGLLELLGTWDLGDEADQVPVEQDLGLQAGRALGPPDGLAPAARGHLHRVRVDPLLPQVSVDAAVPQRVDHPLRTVLVHLHRLPSLHPRLAGRVVTHAPHGG